MNMEKFLKVAAALALATLVTACSNGSNGPSTVVQQQTTNTATANAYTGPAASTADVTNMVATIPQDSHWRHTASAWTLDIVMLGVLSVFYAGVVRWRIRLKKAMG